MKDIVWSLKSNRRVRYLFIGGAGFVVELLVIYIVQKAGGSGTTAVGFSFFIGLGFSFLLQKIITFGDKRVHQKVLLGQIVAYSLLVAFNFLVTIVLVKIFEKYLAVGLIRAGAILLTTIWNYYLYKTWIFNQK